MRLIDADELIEFCAERWIPLNIDAVNMQPTIQPEPKEGEWEQISAQRYFMSASYFYRCSACGVNNVRNTNFCPNCGAKMRGGQNG